MTLFRHADRVTLTTDELLSRHRTVLLRGEIDDRVAEEVIAKLLFLQHEDASAPVRLYIDSPGGVVSSSFAIRDVLDELRMTVSTHCLASAHGTALVLLAHGARGHRSAAPASLMSLVPVTEIEELVASWLVVDTGQTAEAVVRDLRAARLFSAPQAVSYGLIDAIAD